MCGIFGYVGKRTDSASVVLEGLKTLEYRGYDSWGIAVAGDRIVQVMKKTGKIGDAKISKLPASHIALGHTRWATHGGVTDENAHPHLDCKGQIALIHNGIIENYDGIKKKLLNSGHKFKSETDTEVAVHLIEETYQKLLKDKNPARKDLFIEAVRLSFRQFSGLNAIIALDRSNGILVAAKNGSPLVIGRGEGENLLASDAHALLFFTRLVYFMEDGDLAVLSGESIQIFDLKTGSKRGSKFVKLSWKETHADKGKYAHFMLKEIFDQVKVVENIVRQNDQDIHNFAKVIEGTENTFLVGCGTAAYACLAGTYIFSKIAHRQVNFTVGSEFGYYADFLGHESLVIALSQSGETIDVVDAVTKACDRGAKIGAMVNVLGSTLYRLADYKLLLNAGVETAVVTTKAFTAKLAHLILIAAHLAGKEKETRISLKSASLAIAKILQKENLENVKTLVKKIVHHEHIYCVGRGLSYPIALETALKIKEASYIHAEGFAAGELKHGVIALIKKGTPCIAFLPNDESYGANLAGAMELKARGGYIIGVSYKPHEIFDYFLPVNDCGIASMIPSVVVGQLLGYFLAVARGVDPDKPRNLAKSVTVK